MDPSDIDVHQMCLLAQGGELIERRIPTEPERFAAVLGARPRLGVACPDSRQLRWRCVVAAAAARSSCDSPRRSRHQRWISHQLSSRAVSL